MSKHASFVIWSLALVLLACGCDPIGLRRIQLDLRPPNAAKGSDITVNSPDVQEALRIVERIAIGHGFHSAEAEGNEIRVYVFDYPPVTTSDGQIHTHRASCQVSATPTGLFITFGHPGFLVVDAEAIQLFTDIRSELINRYGKKSVRSHEFPIHGSVGPE